MAYYAALVSLIQLLKEINHPEHPYSDYVLDKQQLHLSLYEKFNLLQELLDGYSRKYHKEESADLLERRIRDAACRAQDIIESHVSDLFSEQFEEDREKKVETKVCFSWKKLMMMIKDSYTTNEEDLQKKYYEDLEKVKAEVDSIVEEMVRIKMEGLTTHQEEGLQLDSHITTDSPEGKSKVEAPSGRNTMVGIEEQLIAIKEQLCGQTVKLEVISIVGMGGLGKTPLARNIFDDKLIDYHFDCRAWVTVSQDYHMPKVLQGIANSMNITRKEGLAEDIRKHLFGRRYLIVIDDIWDTNFFNDIKRIFPDTSNGSRLMLTTRLSDVALYAGNSIFFHQMQFLNEDQSWTLLKQKVFVQEHCPEELEVIGKSIAKNCRGLPLGIVVIAGVLSNVNKTRLDWEGIARHVSSVAIDQNDKHLLNILSLSYNHLPHHLKPCFLYLGGFPEDHEISISQLIRLWVAEGFLKPIESKSLEEVGKEYFKGLVNRNLVLITKKGFDGEFKRCSIHDVLRDLCSQKALSENFLLSWHQKDDLYRNPTENVRRAYIGIRNDPVSGKLLKNTYVRSVILFDEGANHISSIVYNCKLLRILDPINMFGDFCETFATRIVKLIHLRYLKIRTFDFQISPLIFKLQNLQTFIIGFAQISLSLPIEIWKMPRLRHLIAYHSIILPPIPYGEIRITDGVPLLGSLQSLYWVRGFKFTSDTIKMIPNLKKLKFDYFTSHDDAYKYWEEFELNNFVHLHQLEILEISFYGVPVDCAIALPKIVFPSNLVKLSLRGLRLHWKGMSVVGSLPNLQVLKLRENSFVGEEWEPIEGEFLKLKFLLMAYLRTLKYWRAEYIHFPCLEQLYIWHCEELEEIPLEIGDIPTLQLIEVKYDRYNYRAALISSAFKIQEEQRDQGNDDLQVRVIED